LVCFVLKVLFITFNLDIVYLLVNEWGQEVPDLLFTTAVVNSCAIFTVPALVEHVMFATAVSSEVNQLRVSLIAVSVSASPQ
jgi:hypothetical protein